jgi:hypothetical protein
MHEFGTVRWTDGKYYRVVVLGSPTPAVPSHPTLGLLFKLGKIQFSERSTNEVIVQSLTLFSATPRDGVVSVTVVFVRETGASRERMTQTISLPVETLLGFFS